MPQMHLSDLNSVLFFFFKYKQVIILKSVVVCHVWSGALCIHFSLSSSLIPSLPATLLSGPRGEGIWELDLLTEIL